MLTGVLTALALIALPPAQTDSTVRDSLLAEADLICLAIGVRTIESRGREGVSEPAQVWPLTAFSMFYLGRLHMNGASIDWGQRAVDLSQTLEDADVQREFPSCEHEMDLAVTPLITAADRRISQPPQ